MTTPLFRVFANNDGPLLWAVCAINLEGTPQEPRHSAHATLDEALLEAIRLQHFCTRLLAAEMGKL